MKIESQLRSCRSTPSTVTKAGKTQSGKFQQALDAVPEEPRDTFTLSSRAPAVEETPAMPEVRPVIQDIDDAAPEAAASASATEILPGDSTEVKLAKLHQALEEADYTGMPFDEILCDIYKRFNDAFNGDMPLILTFCYVNGPERCDISNQFWDETRDHVWIPMRREFEAKTGIRGANDYPADFGTKESKAYAEYASSKYGNMRVKMLGYGDMSIEEAEQAILKKYAGKDTPRDFLNMLGELHQSWVLSSKLTGWGATACVEAVDKQMLKTYFPDHYLGLHGESPWDITQAQWDAVLDGKFDIRAFAADMRESLKNSNYFGYNFDIEGAISQAINYLLEAVDKSQLASHERLTEQIKREEQEKLVEQTERAE